MSAAGEVPVAVPISKRTPLELGLVLLLVAGVLTAGMAFTQQRADVDHLRTDVAELRRADAQALEERRSLERRMQTQESGFNHIMSVLGEVRSDVKALREQRQGGR
jgi:uncharacterized protein HemX